MKIFGRVRRSQSRLKQRKESRLKQRKESLLSEKFDRVTQFPSEQPERQEAVIYHKRGKLMNIEGLTYIGKQ